jgi:hypothetical protein
MGQAPHGNRADARGAVAEEAYGERKWEQVEASGWLVIVDGVVEADGICH